MTAVKIQSNKIILNEIKNNYALLEPSYGGGRINPKLLGNNYNNLYKQLWNTCCWGQVDILEKDTVIRVETPRQVQINIVENLARIYRWSYKESVQKLTWVEYFQAKVNLFAISF